MLRPLFCARKLDFIESSGLLYSMGCDYLILKNMKSEAKKIRLIGAGLGVPPVPLSSAWRYTVHCTCGRPFLNQWCFLEKRDLFSVALKPILQDLQEAPVVQMIS